MRRQKQDGFAIVSATIPLGDITSAQIRILADLADAYSDGTLRVTTDQNAVFRWVPAARVTDFYGALAAAGFGLPGAGTIADVVSCPGAESCRLAVTQSRGLGRLLGDHLRARPHIADAAGAADIKISGCPNGCGLHHVAAIGFQGSIRKLGTARRAAVLRHGRRRRRRRRRGVRTDRREGSRPPLPRSGRSPGRPLPDGAAARTKDSPRSCAARTSPA